MSIEKEKRIEQRKKRIQQIRESRQKNYIHRPLENIIIRFFKEEDINRLTEICHMHFKDSNVKSNRGMLERSLCEKGHKILVAEIPDGKSKKIIGFFDVRYYEDWLISSLSIHIEHMFVSLEKTREGKYLYMLRGVGSKLMEEVIKYFERYLDSYEQLHFYSEGRINRFMLKNNFVISKQKFYMRDIKKGEN